MTIYCATTNSGKLREFRLASERLGGLRFCIEPLPGLGQIPPPEETGSTFEENAVAKAVFYSSHTRELLFAEDSGLAVDALEGEPGIWSARYAGEGASDQDNNRLLLERMRGAAERSARFISVVALARNGVLIETFRGTVEGRLTEAPRGENGFGYDPIFFHPPSRCTLAEVSPGSKLAVSHRGQAVALMMQYLAKRENP